MEYYLQLIGRLLLACILGGVVGYEREHTNRPAGFRTHILVCVGSALVMLTSEFLFEKYFMRTNADPARLGAQVISGIGFLGAGTIIRDGFNVKGLTTAASLWAVSAVGIAAGIGFYEGAIAATVFIYLTLILLKNIERYFARKHRYKYFYVVSDNRSGQIGGISNLLDKYDVMIRNIEFINREDDDGILIKLLVKLPGRVDPSLIINELQRIDGVLKVYDE